MRSAIIGTLCFVGSALLATTEVVAQETRFSPTLRAGQHLTLTTVDGNVTVSPSSGRTAEIVATKRVRRGDATRVKAVMEESRDGVMVCTVYLHKGESDRNTCQGESRGQWSGNDNYDIDMSYVVTLPAGVVLEVNTVEGDVDVRGVDMPASIRSVDGKINYEGAPPRDLNTVDGDIHATIRGGAWDADASIRTVDGSIELSLSADVAITIKGSTVDGTFQSDFPMAVREQFGPRSFEGMLGSGGTRTLRLSSVDGNITLRRR
jgi:DUF4097 and DUF4098 domain-containing protein YvlB